MTPYYQQDGITLFCGDCRGVLPSITFNALITDPPYGISGSSGTINTANAKSKYANGLTDDLEAVRTIYVPAVRLALSICGRGVVTPGTPNAFEYPRPDDMGAIIQPAATGLSRWGAATWQPVLFYGKDPYSGLRIRSVCYSNTESAPRVSHPCPKPRGLSAWMVDRGSKPGETICDPFAGSGQLLVAAKAAGRRAIGIEIYEPYCELIATQLSQGVLFGAGAA